MRRRPTTRRAIRVQPRPCRRRRDRPREPGAQRGARPRSGARAPRATGVVPSASLLLSERAGKGPAVDEDVLPRDEARLRAREKGAERAELGGLAEAARGMARLRLAAHLLERDAALLGGAPQARADAVGVEGARLNRVD